MTAEDLIEAKTYFEVYRELPLGMTEKLLDYVGVVLMKPAEPEVVLAKPKRKASAEAE